MNLQPRVLINALAALVAVGGAVMLVPAAYSLLATEDGDAWVFWLPGGGTLTFGVSLFFLTRGPSVYVSRQTVFLVVVMGWLAVATVGALPFFLSGLMGPVDAFFNSMAGFTTTGAATVAPEELSESLLLWRSVSQ